MGKGAAPDDLRESPLYTRSPRTEQTLNDVGNTLLLLPPARETELNGGRAGDVNGEREEVGQISALRLS
jgi:hypothetical protein